MRQEQNKAKRTARWWVLFSLIAVAVQSHNLPVAQVSAKESAPINVLLISIDTLRGDHVGCLGYDRSTSPNIDKLASEGCLFSDCVSTSNWTIPAHMSMFTSLYPVIHGVTGYEKKLDERRITLAEILKDNGYVTGGFVSGAGRELQAEHGFDQGFDCYDDFTVYFDQRFNLFEENETFQGPNDDVTCPIVHRIATRWLKKNYKKKFFLFVHLWDVHNDYIPPPPYDTMFDPDYKGKMTGKVRDIRKIRPGIDPKDLNHIMSLYDGEIKYVDEWIGKLMGELEMLGVADNTLIVLTADHGEEFNEHGGNHHGRTLYDESTYVPLIFRLPGKVPEEKVIKTQVSLVDILPTVLDVLGIETDAKEWQGMSILPLIQGEDSNHRKEVFIESQARNKNLKAVRTKEFKFVYDFQTQEKELYNLVQDPAEKNNLIKTQTQKAGELEQRLMSWLQSAGKLEKSLPKSGESNVVVIDEDRKKRLEALGYLH